MDVFSPDPDVDDEATIACSELEKINNSSNDADVSPSTPPRTSKSKPTIVNSIAVARTVALCNNGNNRKRCISLVVQGAPEIPSPNNVQQLQQLQQEQTHRSQQMQQTQQIVVHPKQFAPQRPADPGNQSLFHHTALLLSAPRQKIPRPPNAFMLFANEWRKKLAVQFPRESNKDISVRLGAMWKTMQKDDKEKYFTLAREVDAEHKRKYPDYVYNPKEARMRKALREQSRETRNQLSRCHTAANILPGSSARQQQWGKAQHQGFPPGIGSRQPRQGLISPRMLAEQRSLEETKKAIREQVEQGMVQGYTETYVDIEAIPYHQLNHMNLPGGGDYVIAEIDGQQWLPYMQAPQSGANYMMRSNEEVKLQQNGPWNQYGTEARSQQVASYPLRQQMMNGSYGSCMPNQHIVENSGISQQASVMGQMASRNDRDGSNNDTCAANSIQQQQFVYQQQPVTSSSLTQNMTCKEELNREERMQMLELIPTSSASSDPLPVPSTTSATAATTTTTTSKSETPSSTSNSQHQTTSTSQSKSCKTTTSNSQSNITDITSTNVANGTENSNGPLPAFEQAFGSTEIGRYSHEGFFNTTQQNENQQSTNNQNLEPKSIPAGTNPPDMAHLQQITSVPDDFPSPGSPNMIFSPTNKTQSGETLMSPSGWPLYFYSPGSTTINQKAASLENGHRPNIPQHAFACYGSPQYPHPPYATYYDYAFLSGHEFMTGSPDSETILVGVPPSSAFGEGNELQVALDGGGSTVLASGNTYRDVEAGLDYVTLHIPANAITNNDNDPLEITNENGETILLQNEKKGSKNISGNLREDVVNQPLKKQRKLDICGQNTTFNQTMAKLKHTENNSITNNDTKEKKENTEKNINIFEKITKKDDLERQDVTITGMAVREPIVISQTDRICVLMDTPTPVTDGKEFTSL